MGTYSVEVSEVQVGIGGPGVAQGASQNCIMYSLDESVEDVRGVITATWNPTAPSTQQLALYLRGDDGDVQIEANGAAPLALNVSGVLVERNLRVFLGISSMPGLAVRQSAELEMNLTYVGGPIPEPSRSTCVVEASR